MTLPVHNLYPAFNIIRLSHVELGVSDLTRSRAFYEGVLGFQVTGAEKDSIYIRAMEQRGHHCVVLRKREAPAVDALGFRVFAEGDLDRAKTFFDSKDVESRWVARPHQGRTLMTHDPFGAPLEFYHRMERLPHIHQKYGLYKGVTPLRIDHLNCYLPSVDRSAAFFAEMGFRVTEYTEDEATKRLWAVWMHRKGGVHDIAFTNGRGPRLHHLAFWVASPMNIIDLLDQMATTGYVGAIERGPGRHGISNAFFLYVRDPDGHRIEVYCSDYQTVDPDLEPIKWDLKDPQRQTLWGAPAPRTWFEEGSVFTGVPVADSDLEATPIIAP